jgi:hypothetical protein
MTAIKDAPTIAIRTATPGDVLAGNRVMDAQDYTPRR